MKRLALSTATAVVALLAATLTTGPAGAATAPATPTVKGVTFSGDVSGPTVTITGSHFRHRPHNSWGANDTTCGQYVDNGRWWGINGLWIKDDTNAWQAGAGNHDKGGNCIGIKVLSWTPTQVVFIFGSAYGSYDDWTLDDGDAFTVSVRQSSYSGTVSYGQAIPRQRVGDQMS